MELTGKKTLVLGAGRSGIASARFLAQRGATVALHDKKELESWSDEAKLLKGNNGIGLLSGDIPSWLLDQIDLVVISPGVPTNTVPARYVHRKDGEVIGEVELAFRFLKGRIVGITGSNGKTTTTTLIGELLKNSDVETLVGGNIGTPLISLVEASRDSTWTVAELSSFQLETIKDFRPAVGICLNVTPNHLDRYGSFTDYAAAKRRLFMKQSLDDIAVLNADDPITFEWASGLKAKTLLFSVRRELDEGFFLRGRDLIARDGSRETVITNRESIFLRGLHNVENILAAIAAASSAGAKIESMRETVSTFKGVEHRIEFVEEINGVRFYNDSKATSVDATLKALEAFEDADGKVILILGGRGKNAPYSPLIPLIEKKVRTLILIGEDAQNIERQLGKYSETITVNSLAEAVLRSLMKGKTGDVVLLAPACASFDMFNSFEERGRVFKSEVKKIIETQAMEAGRTT